MSVEFLHYNLLQHLMAAKYFEQVYPVHLPVLVNCSLNNYLYLDESECNVLVRSLVQMKNRLIREERFTDCVDELIMKDLSAPVKRI